MSVADDHQCRDAAAVGGVHGCALVEQQRHRLERSAGRGVHERGAASAGIRRVRVAAALEHGVELDQIVCSDSRIKTNRSPTPRPAHNTAARTEKHRRDNSLHVVPFSFSLFQLPRSHRIIPRSSSLRLSSAPRNRRGGKEDRLGARRDAIRRERLPCVEHDVLLRIQRIR